MSPEAITAWAAVGTLVVIGASAVAALVQLQHMRAGNQLEAFLSLERDFRAPELQSALVFIQRELPGRLDDPAYRRELEQLGFVDATVHPELIVCNWFNTMGALLKSRLVSEQPFMDLFGRLIVHCWKELGPVLAIMRRTRGEMQYHDFEYLAARASLWLGRNARTSSDNAPLPDRWFEIDRSEN